ncbi:hypothetical protein [Defluviimonas sp. WL0075]|uniref:Uncharacterized protein n=1 Tax=Albidovulum sediminicola TaxID=2984331 RepID=A0ABT2Z2B9_9RHOB|nr:hypothetical protein [Defluviimonas sp. WL0075]MCV2865233.1 hypothetical protein [Defluviimonas sp. WL0075]
MILDLEPERRHFPAADLGTLLERHGPVRVTAALAVALFRHLRRPRVITVDDLPPRLRRDVGLNWDPPRPRPWDLRL